MNIAAELQPIAEAAAKVVGQDPRPGDWIVIISGTISADKTTSLRWEWYWRPTATRVPDPGPIEVGEPR